MWRFSLVYFPLIRPARPLSIVHAHDDHIWCDCDATHREMYRMTFEIDFGLNNECDDLESETINSQVSGLPNIGYFDLDIRSNHWPTFELNFDSISTWNHWFWLPLAFRTTNKIQSACTDQCQSSIHRYCIQTSDVNHQFEWKSYEKIPYLFM